LTAELSKLEQAYLERARTRKASGQAIIVPIPKPLQATRAIDVNAPVKAEVAASTTTTTSSTPSKGGKHSKDNSDKGGDSGDPEGVQLLTEIESLRARISQRLSQKSSVARNMTSQLQKFQAKMNSDLAFFETTLRSCGDFASASGVLPGADVAIRPNPQNIDEMILGRVIAYHADIGAYVFCSIASLFLFSLCLSYPSITVCLTALSDTA
jgi:hypothetical protein